MWKNWYVQPTKPEKRRKNYRGGVLVAALLLLLSLPGCGYGSYEKITTAQTAENGAGQSENRKEEAGTEKDYGENTAAEIVLETEAADAGAARGENPDGAQGKEIRGNFRKIWSEKLPNFQKTLALPCRFSFLVTCFCQTMC